MADVKRCGHRLPALPAAIAVVLVAGCPYLSGLAPCVADVWRGIEYADRPGADGPLTSLDVYSPRNAEGAPVVIYVHGGSWRTGDKRRVRFKPTAFAAEGYVFVSINYRLSPAVQHPAHVEDVAAAIVWIHEHVAEFGGDPDALFLLGHSAGAHLVALVATDERYLAGEGASLDVVKGVVGLDAGAYDIPLLMAMGEPGTLTRIWLAFGSDPAVLEDASPTAHVEADKGIPPFLLVHAGPRLASAVQAETFRDLLLDADVPAVTYHAVGMTHQTLNERIGMPGDATTVRILEFLEALQGAAAP
ncbi:MAG: alpha/beta hydrolase [Candidatus Hydrogenedentes bacterium]|nr:alpha/beta hydrolase [Candidatus Hydrogenedentota bacterium]